MKPSVIIRDATKHDAQGKGYVHYQSWVETYTGIVDPEYMKRNTLERCVNVAANHPENQVVAVIDDKIVGFAAYNEARDDDLENTGEVMAIYVLKDYHKQGIGSALMNECYQRLNHYDDIIVWVLHDNHSSRQFYASHGFKEDGATKDFHGSTVIRMIQTGTLHHPSTNEELLSVYNFFYEQLNFNVKNDGYIQRRKEELYQAFTQDPKMIAYITKHNEIISAISMKEKSTNELTMAMLATKEEYRDKHIATRLTYLMEQYAKDHQYNIISLGARTSAASFYEKQGYQPMLLIQAFGDTYKQDVLDFNTTHSKLPVLTTKEEKECDYIFLATNTIKDNDIQPFLDHFKDIDIQYIFTKTFEKSI